MLLPSKPAKSKSSEMSKESIVAELKLFDVQNTQTTQKNSNIIHCRLILNFFMFFFSSLYTNTCDGEDSHINVLFQTIMILCERL